MLSRVEYGKRFITPKPDQQDRICYPPLFDQLVHAKVSLANIKYDQPDHHLS